MDAAIAALPSASTATVSEGGINEGKVSGPDARGINRGTDAEDDKAQGETGADRVIGIVRLLACSR
jgi:hypothetical protein